jgi:hypothetical protein
VTGSAALSELRRDRRGKQKGGEQQRPPPDAGLGQHYFFLPPL